MKNSNLHSAVSVSGKSKLRLARGVKMREDKVRARTVLLAPERTIALDETGIAILGRLDGLSSLDDIVEALAAAYGAPRDLVLQDTTIFLQGLADRRFLESL